MPNDRTLTETLCELAAGILAVLGAIWIPMAVIATLVQVLVGVRIA